MVKIWFSPCKRAPDDDGPFFIGEIGEVASKNWAKATPYSPAEIKLAGIKFNNEMPQIAFVNDLEEPDQQPFFW